MNLNAENCPLCGEGTLVPHQHERTSEIDGHKFIIRGFQHSICDHCHERVTTPAQSRHNKQLIIEARALAVAERDRNQRLSPAGILAIRKKFGLTQAQAARVFGGGTNAFSKYENGEVTPSDGMEKLLRLSDEVPEAAQWLLRRGGLPVMRPVNSVESRLALALYTDLRSRISEENFRLHYHNLVEKQQAADMVATAAVSRHRGIVHSAAFMYAANDSSLTEASAA